MSTVVIDARGWQHCFDLKSGEEVSPAGPVYEMAMDVLAKDPYPGDTDEGSNRWVSNVALAMIGRYHPRFVFLTYAQQYFSGRYVPMTGAARASMISRTFQEVERFLELSGFSAIVVGTGGMTPLVGTIDLTALQGLAICTHWSARYAGLFDATDRDLELLKKHPGIEGFKGRQDVLSTFGEPSRTDTRVPEYLLFAREGHAFKTVGTLTKMPVMIPGINHCVPVCAPENQAECITDIRRLAEKSLESSNTALIVIEGAGCEDFPWPYRQLRNGVDWFDYEPSEAQYMTITSGRHRFLDYPTGQKYSDAMDASSEYPFSGIFKSVPEGAFPGAFPGRSIAVGNKSMFMHMVTGTDISVECFARNLYNHGAMAVIHRDDKP